MNLWNLIYKVEKKWSEEIKTKTPINISLIAVRDGEEIEVERVVLNEENGYKHSFEHMPLESVGRMTYKIKEIEQDYDVTYSYKINDSDNLIKSDSFSTEDLVDGDTVMFTVENNKKPDPKFNLKVKKSWTDRIDVKEAIKIKIYSEKDTEKSLISEFILKDENNFEKEISGLPILENGTPLNYYIEEIGDNYIVKYTYKINDGEFINDNHFSTDKLSDGDTVSVNIVNDKNLPPNTPKKIEKTKVKTEDTRELMFLEMAMIVSMLLIVIGVRKRKLK